MSFPSLIRFTVASTLPYKSLTHLQNYFYFSNQVAVQKNPKLRRLFILAFIMILYQSGHLICLYFWPSKSLLIAFRHADFYYLLLGSDLPVYNLLTALCIFQTAYNFFVYYFAPNRKVNAFLESILITGKTNFFLVDKKEILKRRQPIAVLQKKYHFLSGTTYIVNTGTGNG